MFYNFALTWARNLSLLKQVTLMDLKVLIILFQKMVWFIGVWATDHETLVIKIQTRCWRGRHFVKFFDFKQCVKKCVTRIFRHISVNCFNRLRFLAEVSSNLQKCTFLDNFSTITQEGNTKTRQMTLFSSSTFSDLTFCIIISKFENTQNYFSPGPHFGPFWSVKPLNFWPKATDSDSLSYFSRK